MKCCGRAKSGGSGRGRERLCVRKYRSLRPICTVLIVPSKKWAFAIVPIGLILFILWPWISPTLVSLFYDPAACGSYTEGDIKRYVLENQQKKQAILPSSQSVCSVYTPVEWTNDDSPYKISLCDASAKVVLNAEVYPDCGLEWRVP